MEQTFGGFVRQRRSSMGITLRGLAARLGLSPVYMSNIETGSDTGVSGEVGTGVTFECG